MVAITVILAAVIGAFVLEIGDQQETAPSTSFDVEQQTVVYDSPGAGNNWMMNLTTVYYSHAGGDVIDVTNYDLKVNGNGSAWGVLDTEGGRDLAGPQPYHPATWGTNQPVEFSSGQEIHTMAWDQNCDSDENVDEREVANDGRNNHWYYFSYPGPWDDSRGPKIGYTTSGTGLNGLGSCDVLETGDETTIVWTASSGGKTQTLQKYSVQ